MKLGKFREAVKDFEQAAILYQQEGNAAGYQAMLDQLAPLRQSVP